MGENHHPFDHSPIQYYDFPTPTVREQYVDNTRIPPVVPILRSPTRRVRLEMNDFNNRLFYNTPPPVSLRQHQEAVSLGLPDGPIRANALATRFTLPSTEYVRALPPLTLTLGIHHNGRTRRLVLGRGPNSCRTRQRQITCRTAEASTTFKDDPAPPGDTRATMDFFGSPVRVAIDFAFAATNMTMNIVRGHRNPTFLRFTDNNIRRIPIEERIAYRVAILRQNDTATPEAPLTRASAIALLADNTQQSSHDIAFAAEQMFTSRMALVNYNGEEDPRAEQDAANAIFQAQRAIERYNQEQNRRREAFNLLTSTEQATVNNAAAATQAFAWATSAARTRRERRTDSTETRPVYASALAANAADAQLAWLVNATNNTQETNDQGTDSETGDSPHTPDHSG